ncbi:TetR/AcrR family transcriptional regulator [Rhodococcus pyridinivorans]|uniref:TetR/AcrR family transcriptional regulator n=1 Tax=Rhodococcus pyridinivorans TaxID=103816 RepID=UPI003427B707
MAKKAKSSEDTKSARTRERILDSAAYVLSRKGFAGTRLTDVAEHAELQAPAIYYYFKSREELIEEVMVVGAQRICAHVVDALDALEADTKPIDRILAAVDAHLRFVLAMSEYTAAATRNGGQLPEHLRARHEAEREAYGEVWRRLFKDAAAAGELRPELDLGATRMLVIGALNWAVEWWDPSRGSLDDLVRTAQAITFGGISTPGTVSNVIDTVPAKKTRTSSRRKATTA